MIQVIDGSGNGAGLHIGIAVATWNQAVTDRLLEGAMERCRRLEVERVTVLRVPGALELPVAAKALAEGGCDGVVAIGTVVKGETDHYEVVVRESATGIVRVALQTGVPVTNAILAVHDYTQALERSGEGDTNRGAEAVEAVVATVNALNQVGRV